MLACRRAVEFAMEACFTEIILEGRDGPRILSWGGAEDKREKKFKYASI